MELLFRDWVFLWGQGCRRDLGFTVGYWMGWGYMSELGFIGEM